MALQRANDDVWLSDNFARAVHQLLGRGESAGIIQVKICCEHMEYLAHGVLSPLLGESIPLEIEQDRARVLVTGEVEKIFSTFELVGVCLELAATHSPQCAGSRLGLTIASENTDAGEFLALAEQDFLAPLQAIKPGQRTPKETGVSRAQSS